MSKKHWFFDEDEHFFWVKCNQIFGSATKGYLLHLLLPERGDENGWILKTAQDLHISPEIKRDLNRAERELQKSKILEVIKIQDVIQYRINRTLVRELFYQKQDLFKQMEYPSTKFDFLFEITPENKSKKDDLKIERKR
jgi:hypothetical protein